jgi:ribosomal protein S18 acetylase RimI-like enzyme
MISYREATERDFDFINELLCFSYENHSFGIGYPRGDLEDIQEELSSYKQTVNETFYIVVKQNEDIGIVGTILKENETLLIGPILLENHHKSHLIQKVLTSFLDLPQMRKGLFSVEVIEENEELIKALQLLGWESNSSHISMFYDMNVKFSTAISREYLIELKPEDISLLQSTVNLLNECLPDVEEWELQLLLDFLEEDYHIGVIQRENEVIGTVIWIWFKSLHFGRVDYICVNEEYRCLGYGNKLLKESMAKIYRSISFQKGLNLLHLDMKKSNTSAYKFYKDFGFKTNYFSSVYKIKIT